MGKKAKSQLEKELDKRKENKTLTIMELFNQKPDLFNKTDDYKLTKEAKELLKNTFVKEINFRRNDARHYSRWVSFPGKSYIIGFDDDSGYFCIRKLKD